MTAPSPSVDLKRNKVVRLKSMPTWLPEKFHSLSGRLQIKFKPSPGERRFFRRRKVVVPSIWAPKNRVVTYGPLEGSRWDNSFMPHMRGIMDASFFPSVRYIGNCKGPQTGSSAAVETLLGYIADMQPGPAFVVYPDRDTASKRSTDYLQPMFTESPRLRAMLTGSADDLASLRIKLQTMLIYMGWAGSVTSLGNISARYLVGDEVDKWKDYASKKEAKSLKLFFERFRAYKYGGKCWLISTPSDLEGAIWNFMHNDAQVIFDYHIPCSDCGEFHKMEFKYIRWPEDMRDPKKIEEQDLANYVFPCCGVVANDRVRIKAVQKGVWYSKVPEGMEELETPRELFVYLRAEKPRKICFHSPAWVSPLVSHSEMAAAFLRGLKDVSEMHYFDNQIAAKPHVASRQIRKEDGILILKDDRPAGLVPGGGRVAALVAAADTQKANFVYTVRAIGWGLKPETWLIESGEVDTFDALAHVIFDVQYQDAAGLYYPVHVLVIDSGGDKTSDVYDFCSMHPGRVQAYKGASGRKAKPYSLTTIDTYPGTNRLIPGGVQLAMCDTHHYKDQLASKLRIKPDDPGAWHLNSETTLQFAREMCAEYVNEKRLWVCPKNKANHFWDCSVMELVAVDLLQIKYFQPGDQ